jgi:chitinase
VVTLLIELIDGGADDVQVDWTAVGGTATAGSDFAGASGTATLSGAEDSASIVVPLIDDQIDEIDEQFTIVLTSAVGAVLVPPTAAVVTIVDDDEPLSLLSLATDSFQVSEESGPVELMVGLDPPANTQITVQLITTTGSAIPGVDYSPSSELLVFEIGETSKTIFLDILGDTTYETDEGFGISLVSPAAPAGLGVPSSAVIEIVDDDVPPIVFMADGQYGASEAVGEVEISDRVRSSGS